MNEEQCKYMGYFEKIRGFEPVKAEHFKTFKTQEEVLMPLRKTKYSAGYDFMFPIDIVISPGESVMFFTDVKAYMQYDEVLKIYPRSSLGMKHGIILSNTVGVIDADYHGNSKNDGNIGFSLKNTSNKVFIGSKGEGCAQGIFQKYLIADNCNSDNKRDGGIGSTTL